MLDIDLSLKRGEFNTKLKCQFAELVTGLFGASGAGKSTLLGMLAGLIKPDSGRLTIDDQVLFDSAQGINKPIYERRIGLVFQDGHLFPHLNVQCNLNYGFNLLSPVNRRFTQNQIIELLEIGHLLNHKPHQLSGGEKQRVALGRTLLASPRLLLLDEPLASLDTRLKNQILPFLLRVKEETKIPMLYVSHAIDEILYLTSQVAIIEQGKLLAHGNFHEIIHQDNLQNMAYSLGLENVICAIVSKRELTYGYTELKQGNQTIVMPLITADSGTPVTISIAASNVALALSRLKNVTIQNQLHGVVTKIKQVGFHILVTVNIGESLIVAEVTTKALQSLGIEVGGKVYCLMKAQAIRAHGFIAN
jgi:molybdate transport system ATP-binding protein